MSKDTDYETIQRDKPSPEASPFSTANPDGMRKRSKGNRRDELVVELPPMQFWPRNSLESGIAGHRSAKSFNPSHRKPSTSPEMTATTRRGPVVVEVPTLSAKQRSMYTISPSLSAALAGKINDDLASAAPIQPEKRDSNLLPLFGASDEDHNGEPPLQRTVKTYSKRKVARIGSSNSETDSDILNYDTQRKGKRKEWPAQTVSNHKSQSSKVVQISPHDRSSRRKESRRHERLTQTAGSDDSAEDMLAELEFDEPDRFKSATRLRQRKETDYQRKLRKLKEKRTGVGAVSSEEEESGETEQDEESETDSDFIEDDGGEVADGMLPHQFSVNSTQSPEFKFKVVFHYFLFLVMEGSTALALRKKNREYMLPQLEDQRRKIEGFKEGRVRSQIWRSEFVKTLNSRPNYKVEFLDIPENHCDACNRRGQRSQYKITLDGDIYDRNTYEVMDSDDSDLSDSEEASETEYFMGSHCRKLTELYHKMHHWEYELYHRVKGYYNDLLRALYKPVPDDSEASSSESDPDSDPDEVRERRANRAARRAETARRINRLRQIPKLASDYKDVDSVLRWMDDRGYQKICFRWIQDMFRQGRMIEHDGTKDE